MPKAVKKTPPAAHAKLWMTQMSPKKSRAVANLVRGKSLQTANTCLLLEKVKPAKIILKLLRAAMANAEKKGVADLDRLYVSELRIDEGPRIKRWMPRAQGKADRRTTRTSHIYLALSEKAGAAKAKKINKKAGKAKGV